MESNKTINTSINIFFLPLEFWFSLVGSTIYVDTMHAFVLPLLSSIGFILNLVGLKILFGTEFKSVKIYAYLRIYLLNSLVINLVGFGMMLTARRYIYPSSEVAAIYLVRVFVPAVITCGVFAGMLDIAITLERIFILTKRAISGNKLICNLSANIVCFILFVTCALLSSPTYFNYTVSSFTVNVSQCESHTIFYFDSSNFLKSTLGRIVSYIWNFFRYIFIMIIQSGLNFYSLYLLKAFLLKKSKITKRVEISYKIENLSNISIINQKSTGKTLFQINSQDTNAAPINSTHKKPKNIDQADRKATVMVLIITCISMIQISFALYTTIYTSIIINSTTFLIGAISNFCFSFKHLSTMIVLLYFDKKFRNSFLKLFKIV
jgi:hypothetical protein